MAKKKKWSQSTLNDNTTNGKISGQTPVHPNPYVGVCQSFSFNKKNGVSLFLLFLSPMVIFDVHLLKLFISYF